MTSLDIISSRLLHAFYARRGRGGWRWGGGRELPYKKDRGARRNFQKDPLQGHTKRQVNTVKFLEHALSICNVCKRCLLSSPRSIDSTPIKRYQFY